MQSGLQAFQGCRLYLVPAVSGRSFLLMKIILSVLGCSLAFCLVLLLPACKSESVDLRFRLSKGAKYTTRSLTKINTSLQWLNKPAAISSEMQTEGSFEVADTGNGEKKMVFILDRLIVNLTSPQGNFTHDSRDSGAPQKERSEIAFLLGTPAPFVMDDSGRILGARGLAGGLPAEVGTDPDVAAILRQSFNDTALSNRLQQEMVAYPGREVKPGDTWQRQAQMNLNGNCITAQNTYKLLSIKDGVAKIEVRGKLGMDNGGPILASAPASISGQLSGTQEIEVSSGLPLKAAYRLDLKGTASQMGANEPVSISAEVTVESKRE